MNQNSAKTLINIAIDGYSSSGKSTMARRLAKKIGYRYIDSGAMYRAVALYALRHGMIDENTNIDKDALVQALPKIRIDFKVGDNSQSTLLNDEDVESEIRTMTVSQCVSPVAAIPEVRHALVALQKKMGENGGVVMDGRDIGTTVFPDARMKVFVKASAQTRAQRRLAELQAKGVATTYEEVLANVVSRDHIDETRSESPLRCADDAVVFDNSTVSPDDQNAWILNLYQDIIREL